MYLKLSRLITLELKLNLEKPGNKTNFYTDYKVVKGVFFTIDETLPRLMCGTPNL